MSSIPKILVVDDDEDIRAMLANVIRGLGYEPLLAENGLIALSKIQYVDNIILIILDLNMPIMNGTEFFMEIKKKPNLKWIPVIIFSCQSEDALSLGADNCVSKPCGPHLLTDIIRKTLNRVSINSEKY